MPSATPFPRSPSVLTLYSAADLLTGPGCPVCRYAAEASDRYLAWFALEAHADAGTITGLCASLGMCPRHTRGLVSQPGAAIRLTAVYRYLVGAAREHLAARTARLASCPACAHDAAAASRSLDTLICGLGEDGIRERYRDLGGLCVPHLLAAGSSRGRRAAAWLTEIMIARLGTEPPGLDLLAGGPDHDADARAVLRAALPARGQPEVCQVCLAAARAERDHLARWAGSGSGGDGQPCHRSCLCTSHLRDACTEVTLSRAQAVLAWHAEQHVACLAGLPVASAGRGDGGPFGWLRDGRRRGASLGGCAVCRDRHQAARQEIERCRRALLAPSAGDGQHVLCVRHVLAMRTIDPGAGRMAAQRAAERASILTGELAEAFRKGTWAHRNEAKGPEMTAWLRAAALLDGDVFGGCPPGDR